MESEELPIIKIREVREIMYSEMDLDMEDDTFKMLADWGRDLATEEDFVNIAFREGITDYVKSKEGEEEDGTDAERDDGN